MTRCKACGGNKKCSLCFGTTVAPSSWVPNTCPMCRRPDGSSSSGLCTVCRGTGEQPPGPECRECGGTGRCSLCKGTTQAPSSSVYGTCTQCNPTGDTRGATGKCYVCRGTGRQIG